MTEQTAFRRRRAELIEQPEALTARSNVTVQERMVGFLDTDFTDYQVLTVRVPGPNRQGVFTSFVTFVDPTSEGHEWMIPGEVVKAITRQIKSLTKKQRSRQAKATARPDAFAEYHRGRREED